MLNSNKSAVITIVKRLFTEKLRKKLFLYIQFVDRFRNMLFIFLCKVRVSIHGC